MKKLILLFLISTLPCAILFPKKSDKTKEKTIFGKMRKPRPLSMTYEEMIDSSSFCQQDICSPKVEACSVQFPEEWILDSALDNAPPIVLGIITYLRLRTVMCQHQDIELANSITIPSYHRLILVGPPGSGKTTLAYAIAKRLGCNVAYIAAASLRGDYRNQTGINISRKLKELTDYNRRIVIIIDELHKLFEHHENSHSDDSQTAAAFWLALDEIEKHNPHAIIIGTANNVNKLPPEIKSRFVGKIIEISIPDRKQKVDAFQEILRNDKNIALEESCDALFLENIAEKIDNCSLRDLQLLVDTAKIIYYAENLRDCESQYAVRSAVFTGVVLLTRKHFQQALDQLKAESLLTKESLFDSDKFTKKLQNWSVVLSIASSVMSLAYYGHYFVQSSFGRLSIWFAPKGSVSHA